MKKEFINGSITKISSIVFLALCLGFNVFNLLTSSNAYLFMQGIVMFCPLFVFVFFLFLSFAFFTNIKSSGVEETLRATKNGYIKAVFGGFFAVMLLAVAGTLIFAVFSFLAVAKSSVTAQLVSVVANCLFFNIFCVSLLGAFLGTVFSFINRKALAFTLIGVTVFLFSPLAELIASNINNYTIVHFFSVFDTASRAADMSGYGYPASIDRVELMLAWAFACVAVILFRALSGGLLKKVFSAVVCCALCVGFAVCSQLPASRIVANNYDPKYSMIEPQVFYSLDGYSQKEEKALFSVEKYELDIKVGRELNVTARLTVDVPTLESYKLTLCHNYRVLSVCGSNGDELPFTQDGDYIEITNPKKSVDCLVISYKGSSPQYYSNSNGVNLPGYFAYYPHAGYHKLFGNDYSRMFLEKPVRFDVSINSSKEFFCNLDEVEKNHFVGTADSLTLLNGLYKSQTVDGVEVIYPYLNEQCNVDGFGNAISEAKKSGAIGEGVKKIFWIPSVNQLSPYLRYAQSSDSVLTVSSLEWLNQAYEEQACPEYKYNAKAVYEDLCSSYENFVEMAKNYENDSERGEMAELYTQYKRCIDKLGLREFRTVLKEYLADNSDTRTPEEFLADLYNSK